MAYLDNIKEKERADTFVIVTQDWCGLGWGKMLRDCGQRVIFAIERKEDDEEDNFEWVGENMGEKMDLSEAVKSAELRNAYWIWDYNHNSDVAEKLRSKGYKVFGGQEFADKSEHDRDFGLAIVKRAGLQTPESFAFSDINAGITHMMSNPDKAYVFKPDEPGGEKNPAWQTTVPDNDLDGRANEEMQKFLESFPNAPSTFILQERKSGVEINIEVWLYDGKPILAYANFECKKKYNHDLGPLVGCAQDIGFIVPLNCKIVEDTIGVLIQQPEYKNMKGMLFADMNLIVGKNQYWFLEFCNRFGYNSHPNLFINLAIDPFDEIIKDLIDGEVENMSQRFDAGFGASITMRIDEPVHGLPLIIPEELGSKFYHFDTYWDDDEFRLAGYGNETGIVCGHDYDLKSAAEEVKRNFDKIHFPFRAGRTDIDRQDYFSNPYERWVASNAMKLFDPKS